MPPVTFCHSCEEILTWIDFGVFRPDDPFYGRVPRGTLLSAPKPQVFDAECPLCAMFECLLDREPYAYLGPDSSFWVTKDPALDANLLRLFPYVTAVESLTRQSICIEEDLFQNSECYAFQHNLEQYIASLPEFRSTWSLASLNTVLSWLSDCRYSHSDCNINTNSGLLLPKRLVDDGLISAPPTSEAEFERCSLENMPKVRICETSTLTHSPQYLTLSHRWDPIPTILLDGLPCILEFVRIRYSEMS